MNTANYSKAAWLSLVLVSIFVVGWERYWRHKHYVLAYNDERLWVRVAQLVVDGQFISRASDIPPL